LPNVEYGQDDWTSRVLTRSVTKNGLCYFDDHVDQAKRLIEAHARGFRYAIFDDDFPVTAFAHMAPRPRVLPKVEFVLDDSLLDGDLLKWTLDGTRQEWRVDRKYLDRARQTIEATERLPNSSLITGIHQTPYRVVRLAS
jgi:hypothetical protein